MRMGCFDMLKLRLFYVVRTIELSGKKCHGLDGALLSDLRDISCLY